LPKIKNMSSKKIYILILLLAILFVWYNLNREVVKGQTERRFGKEIVACTAEIPIGEAIEEAWHFACQLSKALSNIDQANQEYQRTVKEIAELAKQCTAANCYSNCYTTTSDQFCGSAQGSEVKCGSFPGFNCSTIPKCADDPCRTEVDSALGICTLYCTNYDSCNTIPDCGTGSCRTEIDKVNKTCSKYCEQQSCQADVCSGNPCPKAEIENKYAKLANISRILAKEQATVNWLLDVEKPKIKEKLDLARWLFEKSAPTTEQYQLLRGPTTCKIAVNNFWVKLEDVQKGLVCKSPYNYLVCR